MTNPRDSLKSSIPLRWVAANCLLICVAGAMIFGLSSQKNMSARSRAGLSSQGISALRAGAATISRIASPIPLHLADQYGKLPLAFEPNLGQSNGPAKFLSRGNGYTLFLTPTEAVFALSKPATKQTTIGNKDLSALASKTHRSLFRNGSQLAGILRMSLVGANAAPHFSGLDELPSKCNYFVGNQPANWHTNIPNYRKVVRYDVYRGIDLIYYGTQRQLEYDFVVSPGADPRVIQLAFRGAKNLRTDSQGELVASIDGGEVRLHKPIAYQETNGVRHPVAAEFVMKGARTVAFQVGKYDPRVSLVIDPILSYSTYLGGSNIDSANAIAVAPDNTAFVAGGTFSTNFPTAHPLQPNDGGNPDFPQDAFVTKFSADGSTLLYSTFLGGENQDSATGIAIDAAGNAYVTGITLSPHFPVTPGSFDTLCGGDGKCGASFNPNGLIVSNGFLTKINAAGSAITYSGFIGAFENVSGNGVAVDANENAYVTGQTEDNGFASTTSGTTPLTLTILPSNGAVSNGDGTSTIFVTSSVILPINQLVTISGVGVTSMNPNASSPFDGVFIVLSSGPGFFVIGAAGGPASGGGTVTVNPAPPFPITPSAFEPHFGGGSTDAFVMKISASGSGILYSSYLGGESDDTGHAIAVDKNNDAYVTGLTDSFAFPVTASGFQTTAGGNGDAFFAKVNTGAFGPASLVYSTFIGGTRLDQGNGIAIDATGDAFIAGGSASTGLGTAGAFQPNCTLDTRGQCEGDAFVAEINPALSGVVSRIFFTYLGGSLADSASAVALDTTGNIYVAGSTVSPDFPTTAAAFQPSYGGGNDDAFVTKLNPTGSALVYSGFLGGTDTDNGYGIAVDTSGSAYVAGQTCSSNFPTSNAEQVAPGGNCDAFVSKVTILNGIELNPSSLNFPAQSLGTTSQPETVTLTNGDATLTSLSIALGGTNPGDFENPPSTTCMAPLAPGAQCTITETFAPTASGSRTATITLTDSAPDSPQVIHLSGTTSTLTLSASSLDFHSVPLGSTSAPQSVIATNNGTIPIMFSSITASGDFAETDDCIKVPLQPTTNCVINVTYTPTAAGVSVGALTLTDNAPGSPQVVLLNGNGTGQPTPSFSLIASPTSGTVSAGQSASFALTITPTNGFSQLITLSCSGTPAASSCSASQNPVMPSSTAPTIVKVTVSTGLRTLAPPASRLKVDPIATMKRLGVPWLPWLIVLVALATVVGSQRGQRRTRAVLGLAFGLAFLLASCGGGNAANTQPGTPAGTYTITVTATGGSSMQTTTFTLKVN